MDVRSGPVEYNGSEQKPKVSIHLDGVPLRGGSITGCPMQTIWMLGPLW